MNQTDSVFIQKIIRQNKGNVLVITARVLVLLAKLFNERRIPVLAQSLAYTTIFTLVPILAAFFAVLGIVSDNQIVVAKIRETIATYFVPEYVNIIFDQFEKLTAASAFFGVIGLPALFLAGVFLYAKVHASVNEIWLSEKKSMWFKNFKSFFMTLIFGPMILVLVFSLPPYLQTIPYFREVVSLVYIEAIFTHLIPISVIFLGLFVLYCYIPVIAVRYSAAMQGAMIAALVIQGSNYLVSYYLKSFSKLNIIYGSLAMFPIFLLWVYVTWLVVLTGAVLAYIFHYHRDTVYVNTQGMYNDQSLLCSSLQVMMYLVQSFQSRGSAPGFDQIQLMLGINRKRLSHILKLLCREKLVIMFEEKSGKRPGTTKYQLGVSPRKIRLYNLIPLFYDPHDHLVFEKELNDLIKILDIHPGFLMKNLTLYHLQSKPGQILEQMHKIIEDVERLPREKAETDQHP
jgi:membrane protein